MISLLFGEATKYHLKIIILFSAHVKSIRIEVRRKIGRKITALIG